MKTLSFLFSGVLLFLSGNFLQAQTINKNYIDGEVYVKLKERPLAGINLANGAVNMAAELPFLQRVSHISNTLVATRSFYFSNSSELQKVYRLKIGNPKQVHQFIKEIGKDPNVEYAEPVPYREIIATPNDPQTGNQYHLGKVKAFEAWDVAQGTTDIIVAVVDNAIQANHEDLAANMLPGRDISDNDNDTSPPDSTFSHGTHVAGLVGAVSNNNIGVASAGFNRIKILPVKVTPNNGTPTSVYHGFEGIAWAAANGAKIINVSWGGYAYSITDQAVINNAYASGAIIIAAAGNEARNSAYYPASYTHVVSVASTNFYDDKSSFSNYHSTVDLTAPGSSIFSTKAINKYGYSSGTSMAAPIVSSIFGYVWSVRPTLSQQELENLIKNTSDNLDAQNPAYAGMLGSGRVNALKAVSCLQENILPSLLPAPTSVLCTGKLQELFCTDIEGATYTWKKDGVDLNNNQAWFVTSESGQYIVKLAKNTCEIETLPITVSFVPTSVELTVGLTKACVGDSILLTAPNLTGIHYQWKKDGVNIGTNSYRFYAKQNANYTVSLSGDSCSVTSPEVSLAFVTLNPQITSSNATLLCAGQSTTLLANNEADASYQWKKDGALISGATAVSYQVNEAGEYTVEQKLGQCVLTSNKILVSYTTQMAAAPSVTNREICEGQALSTGNGLQASAENCVGSATFSYAYTGNVVGYDGNQQTGSNPTITISDLAGKVVGKIRVTVKFDKKDQNGLNDCALPHGGSQPYTDEVSFRLQSPDGTIITLLASGTYNYYVYNGAITLTFEDGKPAINVDSSPLSGTFSPLQALSAFNGLSANGTWTLLPNDNSSGDPLCVSAFSVDIQVDNISQPSTFSWWSASDGGQKLGTGHEFIPANATAGINTYYVQNQCAGVCPSTLVPVTLNIKKGSESILSIMAYALSDSAATAISPKLAGGILSNKNPTTIKNGIDSTIVSLNAPLIDPLTVCSGTKVLLLGSGCNSTLHWSTSQHALGIIASPSSTSVYSVACDDANTGCWNSTAQRTIQVKPSDVTVSTQIPQKGLQEFVGNRVSVNNIAESPSVTSIKAENSVVLLPGFQVEGNSVFTAQIAAICPN
ncbi:S8 family serine peptidase [Emticicia soli]|uniref:S8 family serine peptidase n=1 Tax=Emticicia soli TaxID=2027878 RepID=A0ABW5J8P8_9BACT